MPVNLAIKVFDSLLQDLGLESHIRRLSLQQQKKHTLFQGAVLTPSKIKGTPSNDKNTNFT